MSFKPDIDERIKQAREEIVKKSVEPEAVAALISQCLKKNKIDGDVLLIPGNQKLDYEALMNDHRTNSAFHIVWVLFASTGHVAVVGAGKDIKFPAKGKSGTCQILNSVIAGEEKWKKSQMIIIPVRGLNTKSNGFKYVTNILHCRNGVEHCIGEYLIDNKVPILNKYSHRNYDHVFWEKCKSNGYWLKRQ